MKLAKLFSVVLILLSLAVLGVVFFAIEESKPVSNQGDLERFVIPKGQASSVIAQRLQEEGLIRSSLVFRIYLKTNGLENEFQAGSYQLSPDMTYDEVMKSLTQGSDDLWITILEGWRAEEIGDYLAAQDLESFDEAEFNKLARADEGKLYPDSYLIPREYSAEQIHSLLVNTFETKVLDQLGDQIEKSGYSLNEILTMASLVEREAREYDDMRHIAGILWNRIDIGMALQVDATLQYIDGYNETAEKWWTPPSVATKSVNSPYNTYLHPGLPPKPIANPSLNAIKATLNPLESNDTFYLHAPDGSVYYSETLEEHNANIDRYLR